MAFCVLAKHCDVPFQFNPGSGDTVASNHIDVKDDYISRKALVEDLVHKQNFYPAIVKRSIERAVTVSRTVEWAIDNIFSHNEIVALWCNDSEENCHHLIWRGMAHAIPKQYRLMPFIKIFGTIPESIDQADTINIEIAILETPEYTKDLTYDYCRE